jgi:3-hydroxy-9,10-secoandrosta-1,3,5(10)-triene-9,17-dione monooxygenase
VSEINGIGEFPGPVREVLTGIADLLPVLRARAQEAEDIRNVPSESVKSLAETGFFRLLQPASYGGLEADPLAHYTAVRLLASACGSTGWVASVLGVHAWQLALFPPRAQEDVWGADQGTLACSSYAPTGKAKVVEGGYRMSGRWSFSSGSSHAAWVLLGAIATGRVPDVRALELLLRLLARRLGAARRDSDRRRRPARGLPHVPAARQRLRH